MPFGIGPAPTRPKASPHMSNALDGRLTVSILQAASLLGVSRQTLYNQISANCCPVPTFKLGGRRLVRVADLMALTGATIPTPERPSRRASRSAQSR